ncbi:substrate-binding periplasmic protein [Pseudomonas sp. NCHU5208]|uniref:substrate-binding periplasmic protein n=1 Tax=unclassified Pseudomonas TaxID=196821 RepID=UPI003F9B49F2
MFLTHFAWLTALLLAPALASADTIRAVTEDSLYAFVQDDKVAGPATAVVEATLHEAGLDYQLALYPWARAYDLALQQPNVLIYLIARTPERESSFKWAAKVLDYDAYLYKLKAREDVQVQELDDARGYLIGVVRDDMRQQYLQSRGFTKLSVAARNNENMRRLFNRQIELLPLTEGDARRLSREAGHDASELQRTARLAELSSGLYLAYSASTDDAIVERTRAAFERLLLNGEITRLMSAVRKRAQ